jgi:hypothetical protein
MKSIVSHFSRLLLVLGTGFVLASCGDSNGSDAGGNTPQNNEDTGTRMPNSTVGWTTIVSTGKDGFSGCSAGSTFTIESDSTWSFVSCQTRKSGSLSEDDQTRLDQLANNVANGRLTQRNCSSEVVPGGRMVRLAIDDATDFVIVEATSQGTCYRGPAEEAKKLQSYLDELSTRYVLTTPLY